MTINLNTSVLPIVDANLYGTDILECIDEEIWETKRKEILSTFANFAVEYVKDAFSEVEECRQFAISNPKFYMPKSYNFEGDSVDFDVNIPDDFISSLPSRLDYHFNKYLGETYKSYSGLVSTMPQDLDEWQEAYNSKFNKWKAIVSYIMYSMDNHNNSYDYEENTRNYIDDCEEFIYRNGYEYVEDDEYTD